MREISEHILDITQNSITADASLVQILVNADADADEFEIIVEDNGRGMSEEFLQNVLSPFSTSRTTRKVGLGIPMFKETSRTCDGSFEIESKPGKGTKVIARLKLSHIDRPPLGAFADTIYILILSNQELNFYIEMKCDSECSVFDTRKMRIVLGEVEFDNPDVSLWIRQSLEESERKVFGGKNI